MHMTTVNSSSYSSLFTAGLYGLVGRSSWAAPSSTAGDPPSITIDAQQQPASSSSRKGVAVSPRRSRRRSSVSTSSSPMSAIKSPTQRAALAQRKVLAAAPSVGASGNAIWTLPEHQTLTRHRRVNPPPSLKPPPTGALPSVPPQLLIPPAMPRRDSETIPLSPTLRDFYSSGGSALAGQQGFPNLLAPSPIIHTGQGQPSVHAPNPRLNPSSSPILGPSDDALKMTK